MNAHKGHFLVYKLVLDVGLRFPFHDFIEQVLRHYNIGHNQFVPNVLHNILTFIAVCELCDLALSLSAFIHIHYVYKVPKTVYGDWFRVCNRTGLNTAWDKPSKMND